MNMRIGPPATGPSADDYLTAEQFDVRASEDLSKQLTFANPDVDDCVDLPTPACMKELAGAYKAASGADIEFEVRRLIRQPSAEGGLKTGLHDFINALYFSGPPEDQILWFEGDPILTEEAERKAIVSRLAQLPPRSSESRQAIQQAIDSDPRIQALSPDIKNEFARACAAVDAQRAAVANAQQSEDVQSSSEPRSQAPANTSSTPDAGEPTALQSSAELFREARKDAMRHAMKALPKAVDGECPGSHVLIKPGDNLWTLSDDKYGNPLAYTRVAAFNDNLTIILHPTTHQDIVMLPPGYCLAMPDRLPGR